MTEGYANLSGPGSQQVYINVYRESQNQAGNYSTYRIQLIYKGNGYGSYANTVDQYWSANAGGAYWEGSFRIPSPGTGDIWLLNTTFTRGHDGNGFGSDFYSSATIDTSHSSIGDGTVTVYEGTPPRIPKAPAAPGTPTFSQVRTDNIRVTVSVPDNMGSGLTGYEFQRALDSGFTQGVVTTSHNGQILDLQPLLPGTTYWVRVRASNGVGTGPWSPAAKQATLTAIYYIDPATNVAESVALYFWNGTSYEPVQLLIDPELDGTFVPAG